MSDFARRGLGRGLSALLGEPVKADFGAPAQKPTPQPANAPAWIPPETPVAPAAQSAPQPQPHNVVELRSEAPAVIPPVTPVQPVVQPPVTPAVQPQAQQPPQAPAEGGPRGLPIDLVQRNPNQPRKHFDEAELSELADSIRTHGVLQPILVRPIADGRFEIVAGERRWRAAQRAGLHSIPAVVRELDEVEILEIGIIENVQRTDLNPIEEAQGYQALIDRFGRTQQDIADAVGKSRPHIANMLRLLALPDEIMEMVRDGRLSAGHARAILTAPDPRVLALKVVSEGLNVREVERLAQQAKDERHGPRVTSAPAKDADTLALERSLSEALGLVVSITDKAGQGGEVKISYRTLEQLDDVIRRLRGGF
ncbi:MAG TPA: ParB/RepB/Spo0J family partition protein [Caulobacterales bacterium]|nr:ParB/RepB/Spo0J family partition protein [Caulobacterales bacterium]